MQQFTIGIGLTKTEIIGESAKIWKQPSPRLPAENFRNPQHLG